MIGNIRSMTREESMSSSVYSEIPFPFDPPSNNSNFTRNGRIQCSFAQSDFIYDCNGTLKRLFKSQQAKTKNLASINLNPIYSPIRRAQMDIHALISHCCHRPFYYTPTTYHIPCSCSCNGLYYPMLQPHSMYNRLNPCMYPIHCVDAQSQAARKLLHMRTDGTLGLEAICLEKPVVTTQVRQSHGFMQPVRNKHTKRNSSYHKSIRDRQAYRLPTSLTSTDNIYERNRFQTSAKSKLRHSHTNDNMQVSPGLRKQSGKISQQRLKTSQTYDLLRSDESSASTSKQLDDHTARINDNLFLIENDSLSSLDDFVRSPYHRISHNLDAHLYNTDYSSDQISMESALRPLNSFFNDQYHRSTFSNSRQVPVFVVKPKSLTAKINDTAKFRCSYYGLPSPKIKWSLNKQTIGPHSTAKFKVYFKNGYCFLKIYNLKLNDSGRVTCCIENLYGRAETAASLIVLFRDDEEIKQSLKLKDGDQSILDNNNDKTVSLSENRKRDSYIPKAEKIREPLMANQKKHTITKEEIHKLIVDNLIMRDEQAQQTLTYSIYNRRLNANDLSECVYHRIPVKRAQFDEQDDVADINEVHVNVNDRITITTNNQTSDKSYWVHPKGFIIENSKRYMVNNDEKNLRLEIPCIEAEDGGKYKCVKIINKKETILSCNILVK